ncbi:Eukaryotic translation initiation factor 5 [Exophiala dermatitidis]|uniref:Translation initiation factor eIF-5 n=1 Tax=Exophiala dermatitidis (strain ATCC 34100 / CBS 525.76 / NIH/UT8656) TaxID=858893 RepID=H6CB88_EXODN|nr:translation initiation factor eIF-5 [Exophiala dermatitidis NIH/UT8656]EHY61035.1 translation initiation factor eIF-5 [Exophiala dermatitidis NIH/UT8656]
MATINIRRDVTDPFYRYKMERLQSKIEGKGNGIKTVVANLPSVSASLARPPAYVIKYFGFELGAQTNTNPKDDRWIINGAHESSKLQDSLDGFISKFVLCKSCKNPETTINVKDGRILLDCKACGQRTEVDVRHKLSGFILKNEPKGGKKTKKEKLTRRERAKAESQENGSVNGASPHDSNSDKGDAEEGDLELAAGSDDEFTKQITAEATRIAAKTNGDIKDDEWAIDTSAEAIAARAKELPTDLKRSLAFDEDEEGEEGGISAYDQLGTWIIDETKARGSVNKVEDVEIYKKAKELGIETKHKTLTVLAQTIFDENIVKQIPARAEMLRAMIGESEKHMRAFLGGTERFIGNDHPELISQVPAILMGYYQNDLLSEEVAKAWGGKSSRKYVDIATSRKVRQAAEKFLQWLDEAESDDESEDESGEE